MAAAIGKEGQLWADSWREKTAHLGPPKTLYLGGGTPSLLPLEVLAELLDTLRATYDLSQLTELTLEANPDDVNPANAQAWRTMGINRVSLGVQSLDEGVLAGLNRSHTAGQVVPAIRALQGAGIHEISADLIFGLPGQTLAGLQADVGQMLALGVPHLSLYGLTIEERTVFGRRVAKNQMAAPDEDLLADMMAWLQERLAQAGYVGYEISNYALPGHEARHNAAYWAGVPYLGLGPSAHSYDGRRRWHNPANNALYLKEVEAGRLPASPPEELSVQDRFNEGLLTGLRLIHGIDLQSLAEQTSQPIPTSLWQEAEAWEAKGYLTRQGNRLALTPSGRLLADHITSRLMA